MMERKKAVFVLIMVAILLFGCSSKQPPRTTLTLNIEAGYDINTTSPGQAAPLQTRLYELGSKTLFEQADFLDLYLKDASTLQDSLNRDRVEPRGSTPPTTPSVRVRTGRFG
ncbi:type VI secretion system lipoprotein TssJ [Endozoicomonas montiporae]|uniref:Putative type VI secretion lipoprotein, VC_A0113 family n=1 Tax=Endozoicomonas montiporae CL-33 TaxID=570277 RepID=A0A142BG41_9GAMM|nr:type VI secretion system lipoprotein TssJ [Endozoicomonas montiporae]AMO57717.1 putative type VI secretion lipoprotein, VC_A0113 family [Endozoicomonas montiporae CL-33]